MMVESGMYEIYTKETMQLLMAMRVMTMERVGRLGGRNEGDSRCFGNNDHEDSWVI